MTEGFRTPRTSPEQLLAELNCKVLSYVRLGGARHAHTCVPFDCYQSLWWLAEAVCMWWQLLTARCNPELQEPSAV
jgi:hypothetical protein